MPALHSQPSPLLVDDATAVWPAWAAAARVVREIRH
jgi:hypothetical protein